MLTETVFLMVLALRERELFNQNKINYLYMHMLVSYLPQH